MKVDTVVTKEKNLLPLIFFDKLKNLIMGEAFPFYLHKETVHPTIKEPASHFMFNHVLFSSDQGKRSYWFDMFEPIIYFLNEKIRVNQLLRMKLNLYTNQNRKVTHGSHIDFYDRNKKPDKGTNIAILNFTTCNGGTKIGRKVYASKANEVLIFNNELKHSGITQTDAPIRILLNVGWK
jgi:hypothetical protein|tara:strand:- start:541 stop:1077 length:537 start_codon:yes stop_codon:yes gene_type:complete